MWNQKDALHAVGKQFRRGESCLLMLQLHRFSGMGRAEMSFLLLTVIAVSVFAFALPCKTPLYWLICIALMLVAVRLIVRRAVVRNYLVLTELAVYRCICTYEPAVIQSDWSDVVSVSVRRSAVVRSCLIVEVVCDKKRLPKRRLLPQKLFSVRFGKLKIARVGAFSPRRRPIRQRFAIGMSDRFLQIINELRTIPGNTFELTTKGI